MDATKYDLIKMLVEVPEGMRDRQEIIKALYMQLAHFQGHIEVIYDHKYWSERRQDVSKMPHNKNKDNTG